MDNYINRANINNIDISTDIHTMAQHFRNMLNNVTDMIASNGPIYTTWIKFQIGINEPIIFDSSSTNPKRNLIATLDFNKVGSGVTNDFTLTIQYDPFNMGQDTADVIEQLDEYVAKAMSMSSGDFDNDRNFLTGRLQYGYNSISDSSLVSPEYKFYLVNAETKVKYNSGISTYTFEGTSMLAIDCDNACDFVAVKNKSLMDIIEWTLYYWYGDISKKPRHIESEDSPTNNIYKYNIEIDDETFNNGKKHINVEARTGVTPWQYCKDLLDLNPLTEAEEKLDIYKNLDILSYAQRPRYIMYLDDSTQTIHVTHIAPSIIKDENGKYTLNEKNIISREEFDYTFSWGLQDTNIIIDWSPQVQTSLYLIRKARALREYNEKTLSDRLDQARKENNEEQVKALEDKLVQINEDLREMYDAQLTILGIPSDIPLGVEIGIKPRILETISRTAGVYMITGARDVISSNGTYTTTLDLFRIRGLDDEVIKLSTPEQVADTASETSLENRKYYQAYTENPDVFSSNKPDFWAVVDGTVDVRPRR